MSNILVNCRFLLDGHDLSGDGNTIDISETTAMQDATTFTSTAKVNRPGLPEGKFSYAGVTQFGAGLVEETIALHKDALTIPILASATGNVDDRCHFLLASDANMEVLKGKAGDLTMFTIDGVSASGAGGILDGVIIEDGKTVRSSAGDSTFFGFSASPGQFVYAIIHVLAVNATSLTLTIKSSALANYATGTNRFQLTGVNAIGGTWFVPIPFPTGDTLWWLDWSGTFTSFQAAAALAVR